MLATFPATPVYLLCFLTSAACAWLLARSYRRTGARLLLWSSVCFVLLAANNLFLALDLLALPNTDLRIPRLLLSLSAALSLIWGFIWDVEDA
ncbi:MAG: DUF5985 family protein [Sphingomicrobium sp.]